MEEMGNVLLKWVCICATGGLAERGKNISFVCIESPRLLFL